MDEIDVPAGMRDQFVRELDRHRQVLRANHRPSAERAITKVVANGYLGGYVWRQISRRRDVALEHVGLWRPWEVSLEVHEFHAGVPRDREILGRNLLAHFENL